MIPRNYEINHLSLEYLPVRVSAIKDGNPYDPTADVVAIAVTDLDVDPIIDDWKSGTWDRFLENDTCVNEARILVGPGGDVELETGAYDIYIKVSDSPETPVIRVGLLTIT